VTELARAELLALVRAEPHATVASVSASGAPQAALVGVAVSDDLEVVFDTLESTRKAINLRARPTAAMVFGSVAAGAQVTIQLEGTADEPRGAELERLKATYYARFPEGPTRLSWPGLTYVRVRPTWLRVSDYRGPEPRIVELDAAKLAALA
jgi:pyridoxine/pyridoxamine 5'-phosphate oxidase